MHRDRPAIRAVLVSKWPRRSRIQAKVQRKVTKTNSQLLQHSQPRSQVLEKFPVSSLLVLVAIVQTQFTLGELYWWDRLSTGESRFVGSSIALLPDHVLEICNPCCIDELRGFRGVTVTPRLSECRRCVPTMKSVSFLMLGSSKLPRERGCGRFFASVS